MDRSKTSQPQEDVLLQSGRFSLKGRATAFHARDSVAARREAIQSRLGAVGVDRGQSLRRPGVHPKRGRKILIRLGVSALCISLVVWLTILAAPKAREIAEELFLEHRALEAGALENSAFVVSAAETTNADVIDNLGPLDSGSNSGSASHAGHNSIESSITAKGQALFAGKCPTPTIPSTSSFHFGQAIGANTRLRNVFNFGAQCGVTTPSNSQSLPLMTQQLESTHSSSKSLLTSEWSQVFASSTLPGAGSLNLVLTLSDSNQALVVLNKNKLQLIDLDSTSDEPTLTSGAQIEFSAPLSSFIKCEASIHGSQVLSFLVGDTEGWISRVEFPRGGSPTISRRAAFHHEEVSKLLSLPGGESFLSAGIDGFVRKINSSSLALEAEFALGEPLKSLVVNEALGRVATIGDDGSMVLLTTYNLLPLEMKTLSAGTELLYWENDRIVTRLESTLTSLSTTLSTSTAAIQLAPSSLTNLSPGLTQGVRGGLVTLSESGNIERWDIGQGKLLRTMPSGIDDPTGLRISEEYGVAAVWNRAGAIRIWRTG